MPSVFRDAIMCQLSVQMGGNDAKLAVSVECGAGLCALSIYDGGYERQQFLQVINRRGKMKKRNFILGVLSLVILACAGGYLLLTGNEKAEITINGTTYEMCSVSVREFMGEDYIFAVMSMDGNSVYTYNYTNSELEAKTYYNMAVPFRPKDGYGAPISCWLYNPTSKPVEIREAMICSISCEVPALREYNVPVSVAGLELDTQTKEEIAAYMGDALKGYQYSENEDVNAISYTKGKVSYTFTFDESDVLQNAISRVAM